MHRSELKQQAFHSVMWTVVRVGSTNLISAALFLLLARLLTPGEFGLYALAAAVMEFARVASTSGFQEAVTQVRTLDEELASAIFWANVGLSVLAACVFWLLAQPYAWAVGAPDLALVLRAISVIVPISALGGVHMARTLRSFGHRSMAGLTVVSGTIGGGCAVVAAISGFGVWSLVVQSIVTELVALGFKWWAFPWIPRLRFAPKRLLEVSGFGFGMTGTLLLQMLVIRVQDVAIGGFLGPAAVGLYRVAWRILEMITQLTIFPVMSVSVVTLARLQDDRSGFAVAYGRFLGLAAMFAVPAVAGYALLSDDLIAILFGPRWRAAGPIAAILGLMAVPYLLTSFNTATLSAAGRWGSNMELAGIQFGSTALISVLTAPLGLVPTVLAFVTQFYVTLPHQIWILQRETAITPRLIARSVLPSIWGCLAMTIALLAVRLVLPQELSHLVRAGLEVLTGALVYAVGLFLLGGDFLAEQYRVIRPLLLTATSGSRVA